jgi:hypothetical protein
VPSTFSVCFDVTTHSTCFFGVRGRKGHLNTKIYPHTTTPLPTRPSMAHTGHSGCRNGNRRTHMSTGCVCCVHESFLCCFFHCFREGGRKRGYTPWKVRSTSLWWAVLLVNFIVAHLTILPPAIRGQAPCIECLLRCYSAFYQFFWVRGHKGHLSTKIYPHTTTPLPTRPSMPHTRHNGCRHGYTHTHMFTGCAYCVPESFLCCFSTVFGKGVGKRSYTPRQVRSTALWWADLLTNLIVAHLTILPPAKLRHAQCI